MHAAGDRMDADALKAVAAHQKIIDAGHKPQIQWSPHHGWVVTDPLAGPAPWEGKT